MDEQWWKMAKGRALESPDVFQEYMMTEGQENFVVVDFFMPQCSWCQKFMPEWNQVVEDMTRAYKG